MKKIVLSRSFYCLLSAFLWLLCWYGAWCCRSNVLFSGSGAAETAVCGPFECHLTFSSSGESEKTVLQLLTDEKRPVLQVKTRLAAVDGGKKLFADIYYPGGKMSGGRLIPGVDNPSGRVDLRIKSSGEVLSAKIRENCDMFISSFQEYRPVNVRLPAASSIVVFREGVSAAEIFKPGAWRKLESLFTVLQTLSGFAAVVSFLSWICARVFPAICCGTVSSYVPAGVISAVISFAVIGTLWSFLENKPQVFDLSMTVADAKMLNPEPLEQMLYVLCLLLSAVSLAAVNFFIEQKKYIFSGYWRLIAGFGACLLVLLCRKHEKLFTAGETFLPEYLLFLLAGGAAFYIVMKRRNIFCKLWIIPCAVAVFYLVVLGKIYLFRNFDYFDAHHYSVFLHPLWMMHSGFSPFEIPTTYGAYAFFSAPYFMLAGLSPLSADCFIVILILLVGCMLFAALKNICRTRFWRFFALAGIAGLFAWSGTPAVYPQYLPLRMVFPAALMLWLSRNLGSCLSAKNCFTGSVIAAVAVFWNPDSGCVLFAAWSIFICCMLLVSPVKRDRLKIFLIPAGGLLVFAVCFAVHFFLFGFFPSIGKLFILPLWFGKLGLLQLPMPWCGTWLIPGTVYFIALARSAGAVVKRTFSDRDKFCFFTALAGCGFMGYYIGRSYYGNLLSVSYPAIIILAAGAERLIGPRWRIMRFAAVFLLLVIAFHGVNASGFFKVSAEQKMFGAYFHRLCSSVEKQLSPGKALIYSGHQEALIAVETGAKAAFSHPAWEEIFLKKDCLDYLENLKKSDIQALWIINMNWVNKHAPEFVRQPFNDLVRKRLQREVPPNAMLMFEL